MADLEDGSRLSAVERRVGHLDASISTIGKNQAAMQSTLENVVNTLNNVSQRVNAPSNINWFGLISSVLGIVGIVSAGVLMTVNPIDERSTINQRNIDATIRLLSEDNFLQGQNDAILQSLQKRLDKLEHSF